MYSPDVTWTDNAYKNTKSYTYSSSIEYGSKVGYEAGPLSGEYAANTTQTGTITVTYDKQTNKLVRVDMTRTVEEGGQKDGAKAGGDNGKKDDEKRGGNAGVKGTDSRTGIEIVTNTLTFDPGPAGDQDRAVAERWLDSNNEQVATPFQYMFDDHAPTARPGADDPFGQLMFDKGRSSRMTYTGEVNAAEYGFELNLGLSLGMTISTEKKSETLTDARVWGRPAGTVAPIFPTATVRTDETEPKPMKTRRAPLAAALLTTAVALTGCGSSEAGSVPDGWGTLKTKGVDVWYPKGYEEQSPGRRGKHNAAAAVRTEDGRKVSVITVQLGFTEANSAEQAAIAAEAGIQLGADVQGQKDVELAGADEAKRIDFTFEATGEDGGPPKGTHRA
ncbi:hypothetical protein SVIOM74S_01996 [Streptomyces violarus]